MKSRIRETPVKIHKMFMELMILFGVTGLSLGAIQRPDYDDTLHPEFLIPSWMASIPDEQPLSEITMPGTHNTMALFGGVYAECQTWSLTSQLHAGIRYLDIRVRHVKGNLTIHHGVSYQRADFSHVLGGVVDFLHEYPSETVLMRVKEEFSETYDIYGAVVNYINRYANWDLLWHSRLVPTMAEARGKLIILQDFHGPDLGMRYSSMDIADDWKVPTLLHVEEKWQSVYEHLEVAPLGNKAQIFLTYSSGAGVFAYPRAVAQRLNAQLYNYLRSKTDRNQRLGIICMDFPAAPMIQMIIDFQLSEETARSVIVDALLMSLVVGVLEEEEAEEKTVKMSDVNPPSHVALRPQSAVLISTIVVVNIIYWMLMIAAIGLGATHLDPVQCRAHAGIPVYLILLGVFSLITLSLGYTKSTWNSDLTFLNNTCISAFLTIVSFSILVTGSHFVYSVYPPNYDSPESHLYCDRITYQFAFVITTLLWVAVSLLFLCGCCFVVITCCGAMGARNSLLPTRSSFYGTTSNYQEHVAGDV